MNKEWYLQFDQKKCIACYACSVACQSWRSLPVSMQWMQVQVGWQRTYPDVKRLHLSVNCQHCVEPACMNVCPVQAISKNHQDGRVGVDTEKCIGCKKCADACAYHVPQFDAQNHMQMCDLCHSVNTVSGRPPCVDTCPTQALDLKQLSVPDKLQAQAAQLQQVRALS